MSNIAFDEMWTRAAACHANDQNAPSATVAAIVTAVRSATAVDRRGSRRGGVADATRSTRPRRRAATTTPSTRTHSLVGRNSSRDCRRVRDRIVADEQRRDVLGERLHVLAEIEDARGSANRPIRISPSSSRRRRSGSPLARRMSTRRATRRPRSRARGTPAYSVKPTLRWNTSPAIHARARPREGERAGAAAPLVVAAEQRRPSRSARARPTGTCRTRSARSRVEDVAEVVIGAPHAPSAARPAAVGTIALPSTCARGGIMPGAAGRELVELVRERGRPARRRRARRRSAGTWRRGSRRRP